MHEKLINKKAVRTLSYLLIIVIIFLLVFVQSTSTVEQKKNISPTETRLAKDSIKKVMDALSSYQTFIEFTFTQQELDAISKLITHLLPNTQVMLATSKFGLSISTSTQISFFSDFYINNQCLLVNDIPSATFESCYIGNLPISDFILKGLINNVTNLIMGKEFSDTLDELLTNVEHDNNALILKAQKSKFLKREINESISKIGDLATLYTQSSNVSPKLIEVYLNELESFHADELHAHLNTLFSLAKQRSLNNSAVDENTAIIWALAVAYGDYRFASLVGVKRTNTNKKTPLLRGREDLTKHFIYSAALQQLGDVDIGLSIGEAKELLDSISGGSGLSFADIAADKAGLQFAQFITSSQSNADFSQSQLNNIKDENSFFPFIHDLPEGFKGSNFQRIISNTNSNNYLMVENEIDKRIQQLSLYKSKLTDKILHEQWAQPSASYHKIWLKTDTHIHTKFSDGNYQVNEIAKQAFSYGCDAIAITDHGDYNLQKVTSNEYFNAIAEAQALYPYLTIMPGLEWNIPPFNGREHATLILPKTENFQRNLSAFRERYDHFERFDEKVLSPQKAFEWLEKHGSDNSKYPPVVLYNHPSRKDWQQQENEHDFTYWRNFSDLVIGFSGAPGHQKKRSDNNGSYEYHLKTINGWDPSVAIVGGEWDRLLQQGYKIWAARAGSDFHNTKMDYWPCQFSSTHLLANSREHNNVLSAYHSGAFWAQHGNFISKVKYNISNAQHSLHIGQQGQAIRGETIKVDLELDLNKKDWQGNKVTLDELELIIITENTIKSIKFDDIHQVNQHVKISYQYKVNSEFAIFRWRGRSIQPEKHHYMFYTNPIKVITKQ